MAILSRTLVLAAGAVLCSACQTLPQKVVVDFVEPKVAPPAPAALQASRPATGSLFQTASYRPSFEDRRARLVGDTVTIQIAENVTASQKSTSTANRTSSIDSSITAVPLMDAANLARLGVGASSNNNFSGKGGTESANTFSGSITATVIEVLPNGHLVVAGEKQIGVNQNVDVLRFSGTVDPRLVQPGSIVSSTQVANVRVESRGRGAQGEAQTVGWLSRFFLNFMPF
ncbi:MAG: flagellar basal body L-ring protein FlgH [Rhodoferax sp.]|nr:flagellar basal body L-ring protein FlgH [Rhodoferax sp.]MCF8208399.1 flagellar basal body L-ring protein FlgH [Rhodoferax sp.]